MQALERAIWEARSQRKLAAQLGISAMAITKWKQRRQVPAERVLAIEKATGVSRHELRPDIYPPEDAVSKRKPRKDAA